MIFNEAYDYLFAQLAGENGSQAVARLKDYQRKRLRRALLARSIKPYMLEASWAVTPGTAGESHVASTQGVLKPLIVLDGAIRTTSQLTNVAYAPTVPQMGSQADRNNFELRLFRTAGNSRVQIQDRFIKDEFLLTPAQAAIRPYLREGRMGQGAPHPLTWPVPLRLRPNELIQVQSNILLGNVPDLATTFCQFRAVMVDNNSEDDKFIDDLRKSIVAHPVQKPYYLSLQSENAKSIAFPATGLLQRTVAKTREAPEHLLVLGYATLFARSVGLLATGMSELGSTCSPKWRLQSSNGHAFSKEEIDINTYAYASPNCFWQEFPRAFLLPKGCSLSASFSTLDTIADATEQLDNYVIFRCVGV